MIENLVYLRLIYQVNFCKKEGVIMNALAIDFAKTTVYCIDQPDRSKATVENFGKSLRILFSGSLYLYRMKKILDYLHKHEIWNYMTESDYTKFRKQISILNDSLNCLKDRQTFLFFSSLYKQHSLLIENLIEDLDNILENYELRNSAFFTSLQNTINAGKFQYCCK